MAFPLGAWRAAQSEADLVEAVRSFGRQGLLKSARGGYDGRSQVKIGFAAPGPNRRGRPKPGSLLGERPCVAEKALDLDKEISVMVARARMGR